MREPVLTEVKISGSALLDHAPRAVPDVYAGAPLRVALRLRPEGGELHVHGLTPAGAWDADVRVTAAAAGKGRAAVVSLYGREAVEDLELSRAAGLPVADGDVERIGLDFQIATRLTSWVAVSEEPTVDPRQPVRRERMPHALPHGMSIEGLGLRAAPAGFVLAGLGAAPAELTGVLAEPIAAFLAARPRPRDMVFERKPVDEASKLGRLTGRLVVRKDRELTFEIDADRDLDWSPADARVLWPDGAAVSAEIIAERTTHAGRVRRGLVVRLGVRLTADGPIGAPGRVTVRTRSGLLTVDLRRA
jgi:Ca-activated chloride channel family protein